MAGLCDLWHRDEGGFAPTPPTGYTWARIGTRALVWDEPPQGRRLNVPGALAPYGEAPDPVWTAPPGKIDSAVVLDFLWRVVAGLPVPLAQAPVGYRRARPCVVVADNASAHTSKAMKAVLPALAAAGATIYYLPPYSPELNRIEEVWRQLKCQELPVRSYRTLDNLGAAVEAALCDYATHLHDDTTDLAEAA